MMIQQLIARTSIRRYTEQPIAAETIDTILQAVQCAPSWINGQHYSVLTITDDTLREDIAALAGQQAYVAQAPVFLIFCADFHRTAVAYELEEQAFAIDSIDQLTIAVTDVGIALGTAVVAAEAQGLGTVIIGGVRKGSEALIERLALPKGVLPIAGLCIGYPAEAPLQKPRLPRALVVHENTYKPAAKEDIAAYDTVFTDYLAQRGVTGNWSKGVVAFYKDSYPAYGSAVAAIKKQGFTGE